MFEMKAGLTSHVKLPEAWFTLIWSPLKKADKYEITLKVPSVAGLYEIYSMDSEKRLNLLSVTHAWYGGLRSQIRAAIDPETTNDPVRKAELEDAELYYRYAPCESFQDIIDAVWYLHSIYFPSDIRVEHSGRYSRIYLNEKAPDRLYWNG